MKRSRRAPAKLRHRIVKSWEFRQCQTSFGVGKTDCMKPTTSTMSAALLIKTKFDILRWCSTALEPDPAKWQSKHRHRNPTADPIETHENWAISMSTEKSEIDENFLWQRHTMIETFNASLLSFFFDNFDKSENCVITLYYNGSSRCRPGIDWNNLSERKKFSVEI